ncbi:MAG: hypothetical protein DMF61_06855 [Blastocatellia bacterium AA13]|nr:MAG: hypothetical protein DMF61_06855 [Blastocatellia bacterium AA13]
MKKSWIVISLLVLSLGALTDAAFGGKTVFASLFCNDLRGCSGAVGCQNSGSKSGCTITCDDGSIVTCAADTKGGGGEE